MMQLVFQLVRTVTHIQKFEFKTVPKSILVAGHDLKFAEPIIQSLRDMGIEVLVDKWRNHSAFDEQKSRKLLESADAVWCEWALGNVDWYTKNTKL